METATAPKRARQSEREILRHEFLTIAEVALLLRVTQRTVYNLIYSGSLRATKITARITVIPKEDFMNMIRINEYNRANGLDRQQGKEIHFPSVADTIGSEPEEKDKAKESKPRKPSKPRPRKTALKPSSDYKQSVKDTFTDASAISEPVYSMEEICKLYNYTYGRFYNLRMRYSIPCVKMEGHKCFPRKAVEEAMAKEEERLGQDLSKDWYSCFDLMKKHGLGKTQVRRFAVTHGVRMKKVCNRRMYYLKADWDAARKVAEQKSASTKAARN